MKILLTGAYGMLAHEVQQLAPTHVSLIETDVDELDITNEAAVNAFCAEHSLDVILNCAAYTAVDKAEEDAETAYAVNEIGPRNLAHAARKHDIPIVHVSTDFVFQGDGGQPLQEDDLCHPRGVYAESKRAGEIAVENSGAQWLTVRTSWLYGVHGKNFPATILSLARERDELKVVNDQIGSPTYAPHLAKALWELIALDARGYVHFSDTGACSWYEFAVETIEAARHADVFPAERTVTVHPVPSDEFPRPAPRPAYSVMDTSKYTRLVQHPPPAWQKGVQEFMQDTIKTQK